MGPPELVLGVETREWLLVPREGEGVAGLASLVSFPSV